MPAKFLKGADFNGQRATNAADPTSSSDLATKGYADGLFAGMNDLKDPVRVATTGNVTLASGLVSGTTIDGVSLVTGDRVLVKSQTAGAENGIYVVPASGAASRATDADTSTEVTKGMATTVLEGTTKGTGSTQANPVTWILTTNNPITLGTTALVFSPIGSSGSSYTADGQGIELSGNQFSLELDSGSGLSKSASGLKVDTSVVARSYQADCAATTNPQTFTHGLGKRPVVMVVDSTGNKVYPDITVSTTTVVVDWGSAPAAADYRVLAVG
jgi:hypothetical protein